MINCQFQGKKREAASEIPRVQRCMGYNRMADRYKMPSFFPPPICSSCSFPYTVHFLHYSMFYPSPFLSYIPGAEAAAASFRLKGKKKKDRVMDVGEKEALLFSSFRS